jgi:CBS domain-containing protein
MVFVREVMTKDVIVADPDCSVLDAAKKMASKKIGGLVVVEFGRPVGLVTERDILWKVTAKRQARPSSSGSARAKARDGLSLNPEIRRA